MTIAEFARIVFEVSSQVKYWHWQTFSHPEHEILGELYSEWNDISDKMVETYAGRSGRPSGSGTVQYMDYVTKEYAIQYLQAVVAHLESEDARILCKAMDTANILADMVGVVNRKIYLLTMKNN